MALIDRPNTQIKWAENGNKSEPATEKQELGWIIEKPPNEVMNWIHNTVDNKIAYIFQEGIVGWDSEQEYSLTSHISYNDVIYKAKLASVGKQPDISPDVWEIAFPSQADFSALAEDLRRTKTEDGYAGGLVYKAKPIMTAQAKGVSYLANSGLPTTSGNAGYTFNGFPTTGLSHNNINPIIVKDGVSIAEFKDVIPVNEKNSTVATTAWVQQLVSGLLQKKVGELYLTTSQQDPAQELGYGTWVRYASGRALVGASTPESTNPEWTKIAGGIYGNYTHQLTVAEMPKHNHSVTVMASKDDYSGSSGNRFTEGGNTGDAGGDQPHNNVQPSIVVNIWRRTA